MAIRTGCEADGPKGEGPGRTRVRSSKALALGSRTLAVGLADPGTYLMEAGEGFDVVLVPVK